ncbi:putative 1-acyl-sn-glycerol-3-phosphate acyltransferase PlsC [Nocardia nova SH22a]|uniref:Putative 1-acyl-sn-glycerol-3-phosphate acyltransferase PlsC n=1 Tax=Nocardia nova SH22a TaxID=1415166 RepID=W5TR69_9NOCA|nr:lysophospholipid acyltransferase family protein [Nocardia nova]AHH21767.1 putative 1-acyl-sn-glycerol-3-phosphate acyltransferase PlsC [Nocardia nova SH22a]
MSERERPRADRPKGLGKRAWLTTKFVRRILRTLAWSNFVHVTVVGRELVPKSGPVIVASNHISMLDAVFLWGALRRRAIAIAMAELWSWPVVGWLVRRLGHIPVVRRDNASGQSAMAQAEQILRYDGVLIIYPEGRLVSEGEHEPYKPGVAKLALATGVPIIPVGTTGTDRVLPLKRNRGDGPAFDRRQRVTIHFGTPVDPAEFDDPDKLLDHLRERIEELRT